MVYLLRMPSHLDGIRRLSPRRGSFRSISRFDWSCALSVSQTGTMHFPARGQRSTDEYRLLLRKLTFRDVSIHTVYERPQPATTPTRALRLCRSKLSWGGAIWRLRRNTSVSRVQRRLMHYVVSITGRNSSDIVQ